MSILLLYVYQSLNATESPQTLKRGPLFGKIKKYKKGDDNELLVINRDINYFSWVYFKA